jgi:hypothetical protein
MKRHLIALVCAAVAGSLVMLSVPAMAQQKTEKQCRDEWKAAGGRKATGKTEKAYVEAATWLPARNPRRPLPRRPRPRRRNRLRRPPRNLPHRARPQRRKQPAAVQQ